MFKFSSIKWWTNLKLDRPIFQWLVFIDSANFYKDFRALKFAYCVLCLTIFIGLMTQRYNRGRFQLTKIQIISKISALNTGQHCLILSSESHIMLNKFMMLMRSRSDCANWCRPNFKVSYLELSDSLIYNDSARFTQNFNSYQYSVHTFTAKYAKATIFAFKIFLTTNNDALW